jgi:hypothetical protein
MDIEGTATGTAAMAIAERMAIVALTVIAVIVAVTPDAVSRTAFAALADSVEQAASVVAHTLAGAATSVAAVTAAADTANPRA